MGWTLTTLGLRRSAVGLVAAASILGGCAVGSLGQPTATSSSDSSALTTCRQAFAAWVGGSSSLNSPGVDPVALLVSMEAVQRRVFELCSLDEAEALNQELQIEYTRGVRQPMIEPDFRTFAETECVDESPLLDGTAMCAEVGR